MKKLLMVLSVAAASLSAQAETRDIQDIYNRTCIACHASGAAGAPKTADAVAWKPRLEKGMDTLVKNAKNGIGAMPPKGLCMDCTDAEFKGLIEYMSKAK
ncbi:Cytochrome c5 [BD1-7 clade bacterium]|uniref:Cytochrome c5 n=1 Tax=BD1-7 clade bacterium TaxID=2029982 RepID=A0A5S9N238_9GAMM|nr:Cytochrome c5 [BD1-7 clade bacterium]CAA0083711.1 Cytochrome c5 [BD1-7 clade bacterium]